MRVLANPLRGPVRRDAPDGDPLAFHRRLPGYAPTPLVEAPAIAAKLGVDALFVKDESQRLGLPSFKILGASWAAYRALGDLEPWTSIDGLRAKLTEPVTLAAATDGNHGRAVAHIASLLGLSSRIFVPASMVPVRIEAIRSEGAEVVVVDGDYDEAVRRAASSDDCLVVADTAWPGYERVPGWVVDGYSTIFREIEVKPDLVAVQIGVGSLASAVVKHFESDAAIVGVEPVGSACMLASIEAGRPVSIHASHDTSMAGLVAGTPSLLAWPVVSRGVDVFTAIDDEPVACAQRLLADAGVVAGETGAGGLAGLLELARVNQLPGARTVLVIVTEGATDPDSYARTMGRRNAD
jgi:diaminopropionate ammonia-lyase